MSVEFVKTIANSSMSYAINDQIKFSKQSYKWLNINLDISLYCSQHFLLNVHEENLYHSQEFKRRY